MPARSRAPNTLGRACARRFGRAEPNRHRARAHPFNDDDDYGDALRPGGASGPCGSPMESLTVGTSS